jgi:BNR repeat protein
MTKFFFSIFVAALALGIASAQAPTQAPPAFVTLPRHASIEGVAPDKDHPAPLRLDLRDEFFEMVGVSSPPSGSNKGGGGGGGGSDFGQNGAVAMVPDCFPNSANNFDVTCAEDSYQGEPMLAANGPGLMLMGASNDIYPGNCSVKAAPGTFGDCGLGGLVSKDGQIWQRYKFSRTWGGHNFLVGFDPSVAVDTLGRAFVTYGVYDPSTGANGIVEVTSSNGGSTWTKTNPVVLHSSATAFEDKFWAAADTDPTSTFKDRIYVAWDSNVPCGLNCTDQILYVSSSSDQGQTWTAPVKINDGTSSSERVIFAFPAVDPHGTVHVLWHDYGQQKIFIDKSSDGGVTWGKDVAVASTNIGFGVYITCNGVVSTKCAGGRFVTPAPQMAIDASGNIYVVFARNAAKGNKPVDLDVFLTKSTDGGNTWSTPLRVSATSTGQQYLPGVSIDSLGRVNVTYLDRRDDPNNCRTNTYLSRSADGGVTFTDSKVTDVDSDFDGNCNGPGDYQTHAAWQTGVVPFFSDRRDANILLDSTTGGAFEIYAADKP